MSETETTVRPALTAEQWNDVAKGNLGPDDFVDQTGDGEVSIVQTRAHALAALALHGQPFGFTREDLQAVLYAVDEVDLPDIRARVESVAARLAALLPPAP